MHHIYIVSDSTGRTAELMLHAALTQFRDEPIKIERRTDIRTEKQILQVVQEADRARGFIVHTLVSDDLRDLVLRMGRLQNVETVDLMGPILEQLSHLFANSPRKEPGLFRHLNEAYFRRIESMEFAFHHDDGQRAHELDKAEIVLVGVSRTFKTPLSIYMAFKGWFVANIPIVLDIEPPADLYDLPPENVFCLVTDPGRLAVLRRVRQEHLGGATGKYADPDYVSHEIKYALKLFHRQPKWRRIDVTNKPIEEIASEILNYVAHSDASNQSSRVENK